WCSWHIWKKRERMKKAAKRRSGACIQAPDMGHPSTSGVRRRPPDLLIFVVLLSLIPLRGVIQETQSLDLPEWTRRLDAPVGPLPATTLIIDGVIFASGVALLALRLWRGERVRPTGALAGGVLLLAAGVLSTLHATQK